MFWRKSKSDALNPLKLIVGLGNPGQRYSMTKHNVGYWVINELLRRYRIGKLRGMCGALVGTTEWDGGEAVYAKPTTYMNNSGEAVSALLNRFNLSISDLCVVYDDLNLEIGVIRLRKNGSDGGHNGMKSIIRHLNTQEFPRLRIGIGAPNQSQTDYVLSGFDEFDQNRIDRVVRRAADAVEMLIEDDIQTAMSQFNGKVVGLADECD
ncbi:MAG: aminoacyl-tRNA hydrolase [Candidatus Poribacteria bacterium]|nr:aminoacyl-tRNA hydrolase [Candidatus Poribacteria bacterium]MDE0503740.1 aminoacyl-tRNA hydrolase [Candidatus Poribacteria bacterium]